MGISKGRRNSKESDYDCAVREYEEETGYYSSDLNIIKNLNFLKKFLQDLI